MIYAATIFLSSFLLFLVQPLIARLILPWFGGSAAVWTTCMLFFQTLLLAGYAYAHVLEKKVPQGRLQPLIHTVLLAAAVAMLPISPSEAWKPAGEDEPISRILMLLGASVGLPYFLVASTSPLLQLWFALSATGSVLLLAVTNHLTQNVASVPLLWLAPLTLYLLTFIIAFEGSNWYQPRLLWPLLLVALIAMAWLVVDTEYHYHLALQLGVFLPGMFVGCLFCHGELYRTRPAPRHLTAFYPTISAGGALGGLLVAVVAPLVFTGYFELGAGLAALAVLAVLRFINIGRIAYVLSLLVLLGVGACATYDGFRHQRDVRVAVRSFYGVLRVKEYGVPGDASHLRRLVHGTIMHGEQYMSDANRHLLTTYYTETSGIGAAIHSKEDQPVKVGVIGLGAGTIAAYGRPGDVYRFYDIDANVIRIARGEFTFLGDSGALTETALGDARLTLEREPPQGFDVLAVDAFSSDAIPVHLITREALEAYLRHMKPDGIVAFHVSNRFLDLIPVVARLAKELGLHAVLISDDPEDEDKTIRSRSDWVLVSRDPEALEADAIVEAGATPAEDRPEWRTWTDDYSNLIQILK